MPLLENYLLTHNNQNYYCQVPFLDNRMAITPETPEVGELFYSVFKSTKQAYHMQNIM